MERGLPASAPQVEAVLLIGAAQILFLDVPDHAAVDLSVRLAQADRHASHYAGLVNGVLRKLARDGKAQLAALDAVLLDTPEWLMRRWIAHYGEATARDIAAAQQPRAGARSHREGRSGRRGRNSSAAACCRPARCGWSHRARFRSCPATTTARGGCRTPPRRCRRGCSATCAGKSVADLCAAPGGKTAQLAPAGAQVTAVDRSEPRLARLRQNLLRLQLSAEVVKADAAHWQGGPFDAVLLDAPCSSTGTIRRHPDIPWLKSEADLVKLTALQTRLLDHAVTLLKPGGTLVYCTCSLENEEGEDQIAALLGRHSGAAPQSRSCPTRSAATPSF